MRVSIDLSAMPPKAVAPPVQKSASRFGRVKSNLKMGIVGLPNVGKSSLFNLMCDMQVCALHMRPSY
jgi:tRNA U34 5-carboxymethylaminomethyl modifying GTPase MnmE/TrmE